jgi:SH3 domain protein
MSRQSSGAALPGLCIALLLLGPAVSAQETGWVSDEQYVPLRSGQGSDFRIVHRGLPSGTRLTIEQVNEDSGYSLVSTAGGTRGWIRSQYLLREPPAAVMLERVTSERTALQTRVDELEARLGELSTVNAEAKTQLQRQADELGATSSELAEIRRISGNAIVLDRNNRQLAEETEMLRSRIEVLEADNQRLQDSLESDAFLNGAFAVLIGVLITLLVPRLWPKRRPSSSWA